MIETQILKLCWALLPFSTHKIIFYDARLSTNLIMQLSTWLFAWYLFTLSLKVNLQTQTWAKLALAWYGYLNRSILALWDSLGGGLCLSRACWVHKEILVNFGSQAVKRVFQSKTNICGHLVFLRRKGWRHMWFFLVHPSISPKRFLAVVIKECSFKLPGGGKFSGGVPRQIF